MRATPRIPRCAIPIHTDQSWLDPLHDRKNGCGKRGNQRFGMIAAAAGNGKGVPQVGALKCLTALLARFANDPDVCSDQQIQLALDGARLHRREYAIQLLMSVRVGQVIQSTVPPELDLRIQESVDRENLARELATAEATCRRERIRGCAQRSRNSNSKKKRSLLSAGSCARPRHEICL